MSYATFIVVIIGLIVAAYYFTPDLFGQAQSLITPEQNTTVSKAYYGEPQLDDGRYFQCTNDNQCIIRFTEVENIKCETEDPERLGECYQERLS